MKKFFFIICCYSIVFSFLFAQLPLKSAEEEYYDFLSLTGTAERPTLGYRTLSDSVWKLRDSNNFYNVWQNNNLGKKLILWEPDVAFENFFVNGLKQGVSFSFINPQLFNSYNTAAPYGQNDGALWQGCGYNMNLSGGIRLEGYGFELTLGPNLSWSQNKYYKIMDNSAYYTNIYAYIWGYGNNKGADAPQRFGESSFWTFDWGDSEIRWSWYGLTFGFGTQSIWLGPAWLNPVLHSNNAPSYPKIDIGLRKTAITIPYFDWYLGEIEARMWVGRLSESDYFDNDDTNDHNQITGIALYFSPSVFQGLILGFNKVCLSKWNDDEFYFYLNPFYGLKGAAYGNNHEDQKVSFTAEWIEPKGGVDIYMELGLDDHINGNDTIDSYITHYWHTFVYTFGLKKQFDIYEPKEIYGEVIFEWNNTEMSQDFQMQWNYSFGFHHDIIQGYTNGGQWIGSGIGYGGQSQFAGVKVYYPKGSSMLYLHRYNPDNNFLFKEAIYDVSTGDMGNLHARTWNYYKGVLAIGLETDYFVTNNFKLNGGISYARIVNPLYNQAESEYEVWHNVQIKLGAKYMF